MMKKQQPSGNNKFFRFSQDDEILKQFMKDISKYPVIPRSQINDLVVAAQYGDKEAREKVIHGNLRLVIRIATSFQSSSVSINDLIQEGYLGLDEAIDQFAPEKKVPFANFASWWIKSRIVKFVWWYKTTVRIPESQRTGVNKLAHICLRHLEEYGELPSVEELLEASKLSPKTVNNFCAIFNNSDREVEMEPLDDTIDCQDDELSPEELTDRSLLADAVAQCLDRLKPKHREFLKHYYGIGTKPLTLKELAKKFGKTHETVRAKRIRLVNYLRKHFSEELTPYFDELV